MLRNRRVFALMGVFALTACAAGEVATDTLPAGTTPAPTVVQAQSEPLEPFDACESFLDYMVTHAVDLVGPYGLEGGPIFWGTDRMEGAAETADDGAAGGESSAPTFSETNVQVEGVDEPDIVKTDGERIVLVSEGELIVVDATGAELEVTGRLRISGSSVHSLFVSGDRALLFGSVFGDHPIPLGEMASDVAIGPVSTPTVQILEVDISGEPEIVATLTLDGGLVSGRMVGDSVRLVITSGPVGFEWQFPEGSGLRAEREATEANREIITDSTEENWIPYFVVTNADGEVTDEGTLFDCERASHPEDFSGLDMLSVVTVDIGSGLDVTDAMGVVASGDTIYASADNLYVATQNWESWTWLRTGDPNDRIDEVTTDLHKFDISDPATTEYLASGAVDGYLLNQFAMDEHDGVLRVATTTTPNGWGSGPDSESRVTTLVQEGADLLRVGMVGGLGETEQIYSVRFMGDVGYVVTFRQTDPLYTVDLSDPRNPRVLGELKIPGYSAYLHPVGEGLVMGIGQDATDEGVVQGTQVSVFDVSDLADPTRIDTHTLSEGTSSQVEYDHHAFLYWEGLAMIPVQEWNWDGKTEEVFVGAIGLRVHDDGTLADLGEISHPGGDGFAEDWDWRAQIVRSLAIGESLYTISAKGIMKSSLDGLDEQDWLDF